MKAVMRFDPSKEGELGASRSLVDQAFYQTQGERVGEEVSCVLCSNAA